MPDRNSSNVKKRFYKVMHRTPAAFSVPGDASAFSTLLTSFSEIGFCEDKTIKITFEEGEKFILDDGSQKRVDFNGKVEFTLGQSLTADYTAYEAIENIAQDLFIYDATSGMCIFIPNALLFFGESVTSGEVERIPAIYEKTVAAKVDFRTRFDEPT